MEYRQANGEDLENFMNVRMEFASSMGEIPTRERFREETEAYLREHLAKDDLLIFIAADKGRMIATCMACIFMTAPLPSCPSGKIAVLLNVYTVKDHRRKGHAEKLLRLTLEELKRRGVRKVILDHTYDGFPLYKKLGFEASERHMSLRL